MTAGEPSPAPRARERLFFESRYRKLVRDLPQTVFYCPRCRGHRRRRRGCTNCDGYGKLTRDSVEELIARRVLPAFRARAGRFHGAGREDVDVRMLGSGRPFVYEVVDPRRTSVDLAAVVARINDECAGRIAVEPFVPVACARVAELKEARLAKRYRLEAALDRGVEPAAAGALVGRRFEVVQRTPERVAHRRADLERRRFVEVLACHPLGADRLEVEVLTEHGTYVKEWVSGEGGRSAPSLADLLGVGARCAALDVTFVG